MIFDMAHYSFTQAFQAFGAKLANPMWAYSAIAEDGALVISCWSHKLKLIDGVLTYTDSLSRWETKTPGKKLLIEHLTQAKEQKLSVRLVIATAQQPEAVDRGEDASSIHKTFHIKENVVGKVALFDGNNFVIEFRKKMAYPYSHTLVRFFLLAAIVAVGSVAPAGNAATSNKSLTGKFSYSSEPLDYSVEKLPPHFQGHNLFEAIQKIKPPRNKGEFEKTKDFEARVARWKSLPFLGSITPTDFLAFELGAFSPETVSYQYDADREELKVTVQKEYHSSPPGTWIETFRHSKTLGSYIGVTGMGVKLRVTKHSINSVGIAVSGDVLILSDPFSFTKSIPVEEAQQLKPNLAAFAIVTLASPYKVNERTSETASLSDPNERLTQFSGLYVWLKSIWLINKKTGDVLVKYEGPFTSCLNYICNY